MRLLQLTSSNLPVGGYTFSQGLEYAIDANWISSEQDVTQWIEHTARSTLGCTDLPLMIRQFNCSDNDTDKSHYWNDVSMATRESKEMLAADRAMGAALVRLANSMNLSLPAYCLQPDANVSYITIYSLLACGFSIQLEEAAAGYSWALIENQVLAATKLLPMGQTSAQQILFELSDIVDECIETSLEVRDDDIGLGLPGLAMASALHETQYSRLYRS